MEMKKKTENDSVYLKWPFKSHNCFFYIIIFLLCRNAGKRVSVCSIYSVSILYCRFRVFLIN